MSDEIERSGGETWQTNEYLPVGSKLTVDVRTVRGKRPILNVLDPKGERIIDGLSENPIRYVLDDVQVEGEYIISLENGAILPENGVWQIEVEICRVWPN